MKLKYDNLLSKFAFKLKLRPYTLDNFLSFDDFARSSIIVLQIITIDGWNELAIPAADAAGMSKVGPYFFLVVIFGGFYVLQLFTSVMIITLSHCNHQMEEQEADAKERERAGLAPAASGFDLQEAGPHPDCPLPQEMETPPFPPSSSCHARRALVPAFQLI